jgi:hypothetical protein
VLCVVVVPLYQTNANETATHGIIFVANKPKTQMKSHCLASALLLLFGAVPGAFSADEVS